MLKPFACIIQPHILYMIYSKAVKVGNIAISIQRFTFLVDGINAIASQTSVFITCIYVTSFNMLKCVTLP